METAPRRGSGNCIPGAVHVDGCRDQTTEKMDGGGKENGVSPKWLFRVANHAIIETMESNKMVYIIDFRIADPTQWRALFQDLSVDRKGSHISA
nr:scarecrow-like protein 3 [Ipomoea trifida]